MTTVAELESVAALTKASDDYRLGLNLARDTYLKVQAAVKAGQALTPFAQALNPAFEGLQSVADMLGFLTDTATFLAQCQLKYYELVTGNPRCTISAPDLTLTVGDPWIDPGATARDEAAQTDLTPTVEGTVDANTAGVYTLTYSAVASDGQTYTATRTVTVQEPAPPVEEPQP